VYVVAASLTETDKVKTPRARVVWSSSSNSLLVVNVMFDFYFTAGCIVVASYGALRHVPARLPFNFLCHFQNRTNSESLSLDSTRLLNRTKIYRPVVFSLVIA